MIYFWALFSGVRSPCAVLAITLKLFFPNAFVKRQMSDLWPNAQ